jgi:hypothetical protein
MFCLHLYTFKALLTTYLTHSSVLKMEAYVDGFLLNYTELHPKPVKLSAKQLVRVRKEDIRACCAVRYCHGCSLEWISVNHKTLQSGHSVSESVF